MGDAEQATAHHGLIVVMPGAMAIEAGVHELTQLFHDRLRALGIPGRYDDYGLGTHSWPYWARDLRESIAKLMSDFRHPAPAPRRFTFMGADPSEIGVRNALIVAALGRVAGTPPPNLFTTLGRHRSLDLARVRERSTDVGWSQRQPLLLAAADELHERRTIGDELWGRLSAELSAVELIELCMLIGHYEMLAMAIGSLGIQPDQERARDGGDRGELAGRRILITGAARGIGAATAERLHGRGARVALLGIEPELLKQVAARCGDAPALSCDVRDRAQVEAAVQAAAEHLGGLDVVIANAGVDAIERDVRNRSRRVFAPRWVGPVLPARMLAQRLIDAVGAPGLEQALEIARTEHAPLTTEQPERN